MSRSRSRLRWSSRGTIGWRATTWATCPQPRTSGSCACTGSGVLDRLVLPGLRVEHLDPLTRAELLDIPLLLEVMDLRCHLAGAAADDRVGLGALETEILGYVRLLALTHVRSLPSRLSLPPRRCAVLESSLGASVPVAGFPRGSHIRPRGREERREQDAR